MLARYLLNPFRYAVTLSGYCCARKLEPLLVLSQACGVDFEIKAYLANVALNPDEVIDKKYGPPVAKTRLQAKIKMPV